MMGIRFRCHHCLERLNIKETLAGKRAVCPHCKKKFRIPPQDQELSLVIEETTARLLDETSVPTSKGPASTDPFASLHQRKGAKVSIKSTQSTKQSNSTKPTNVSKKSRVSMARAESKDPGLSGTSERPAASLRKGSKLVVTKPTETSSETLYMVRPPSGGEYGPAPKSTIESWIDQRRVTGDSMVSVEGTDEWQEAKKVFAMKFLLSK